ncbi:MAG TPA: LysM domain-containing protein [Polyangiales bacterium]
MMRALHTPRPRGRRGLQRSVVLARALWACGVALAPISAAQAEGVIMHVVRPGETLASIADLYYGDPRRESVIVAENGLASEGASSIVVGMKLVIPTVSYHRIEPGETWAELSEHYYGDARRAFALSESNNQSAGKQPDLGAEILVPYPLRQVVSQHDALRQIMKDYYDGAKDSQIVRRFNTMKTSRTDRGQILLLPLSNLVLSESGKKLAALQQKGIETQGETRDKQLLIHDELPLLHEHVRHGRFVEAVAMANRLIGMGDLTGNQVVTIQRELGTALIALDREDLGLEAFKTMLEKQPDVELGLGATSPKVLRVLEAAKKALLEAKAAAQAAASAADAKPAAAPAAAKPAQPSAAKTEPSKGAGSAGKH